MRITVTAIAVVAALSAAIIAKPFVIDKNKKPEANAEASQSAPPQLSTRQSEINKVALENRNRIAQVEEEVLQTSKNVQELAKIQKKFLEGLGGSKKTQASTQHHVSNSGKWTPPKAPGVGGQPSRIPIKRAMLEYPKKKRDITYASLSGGQSQQKAQSQPQAGCSAPANRTYSTNCSGSRSYSAPASSGNVVYSSAPVVEYVIESAPVYSYSGPPVVTYSGGCGGPAPGNGGGRSYSSYSYAPPQYAYGYGSYSSPSCGAPAPGGGGGRAYNSYSRGYSSQWRPFGATSYSSGGGSQRVTHHGPFGIFGSTVENCGPGG